MIKIINESVTEDQVSNLIKQMIDEGKVDKKSYDRLSSTYWNLNSLAEVKWFINNFPDKDRFNDPIDKNHAPMVERLDGNGYEYEGYSKVYVVFWKSSGSQGEEYFAKPNNQNILKLVNHDDLVLKRPTPDDLKSINSVMSDRSGVPFLLNKLKTLGVISEEDTNEILDILKGSVSNFLNN